MNKTGEGPERQKEPKRKGRPTHEEHLGRQRANSFESIVDSFKRKREEKEDRIRTEKELLEKFQKTRAASRSPPTKRIEKAAEGTQEEKNTGNKEELDMDKIDKLTEIILTIKNDTEEIKKENKVIRQEIQDLKEEWKKKQEEWKKEKEIIVNRLKELETKEEQLEKKMARMIQLEEKEETRERRERRNNITLKGEDLSREGPPKRIIEQIMRQELQVEADVEEAYWIRREQRGGMLIAKLKSWQQKREILAKKSKLKGKKLYIDNDLTKKKRDVQKEIAEIAKLERERGNQVKIGYKKIMVNERTFKWKEGEGLKEVFSEQASHAIQVK
ncbi:trichohyalin-like [Camponotus floridanus]|uniref:trichohyalin-like n=1 Tax=Camponotus floridanus TaxID=104421 RepID=UPI000DC6837D|nr:trichohyalin-like [Camponotus floridanus]